MPLVAPLITSACAKSAVFVTVSGPVYSVIVPEKAEVTSAAVPDNAPVVTSKVIAPLVPSLIAFNCANVT